MSNLMLMYAGGFGSSGTVAASTSVVFMENLAFAHSGATFASFPNRSASFQAFNVGISIPWKTVGFLASNPDTSNRTNTVSIGLYSLTGSTLSLANSVSGTFSMNQTGASWVVLTATSATQNITPGQWYLFFNQSSGGNSSQLYYQVSSINFGNAFPGALAFGRMTVTTGAVPASIATSDLSALGSGAQRQPYIILTA